MAAVVEERVADAEVTEDRPFVGSNSQFSVAKYQEEVIVRHASELSGTLISQNTVEFKG